MMCRRCLAAVCVFLFALPVIATAQKDEPQEPIGKDVELKACGPKDREVKYSNETDSNDHTLGTVTPDTALIYVVRSLRLPAVQYKFAVDGEWKGMNKGVSYFFFTLPPGAHYFCSKGAQRRTLLLTVEAGKTYYLEQLIKFYGPFGGYHDDLVLLDDEPGKEAIADAHLSTFKAK